MEKESPAAVAVLHLGACLAPDGNPYFGNNVEGVGGDPAAVGGAALERRDWVGAERAFREALRLRPFDGDVLVNLALSLEHLGRSDEAAELWQRAGQLDPERSGRARRRLAGRRTRRIWIGGLGFLLGVSLWDFVSRGLVTGFDWDKAGVAAGATLLVLIIATTLLGATTLLERHRR